MNSLRRLGSKLSRQFNLSHHDSNTATTGLDNSEGWEPYDPSAYEKADENHPYLVDEPSFQSKTGNPNQRRQEPADPSEWFPQFFDPGWEDILNYDEKDKPQASTLDGLRSPYGCEGAALFEPHFGISLPSRDRNPNPEVMKVKVDDSYEAMLQEAAYLESLGLPTKNQNKASPTISAPNPAAFLEFSVADEGATTPGHLGSSPAGPQSCIICVEDFSATVRAPGWISLACQHEPSVCGDCVARSIKSDLESRMWDDIRCPECKEKLIYDDIQRLADPETFDRYNEISLRKAVEKDPNFVWCLKCNYGQLHESEESQPIVRCQACGFRSCFKHSIEWHERYTCEEYDEMLRDPDGFQTVRDREEADLEEARKLQEEEDMNLAQELTDGDRREEEERQQRRRHEEQKRIERAKQEVEIARERQEEDMRLAQELADRDRREEEERRRRRHEEQKQIERAKQEAEIARKKREAEAARKRQEAEAARQRQERQRAEEEQRKRRLEEERRAARAKEEAEARKKSEARTKQVEALKRKQKEEAASLAKIKNTTKLCPGCSWPIEKNDGCDHMAWQELSGDEEEEMTVIN